MKKSYWILKKRHKALLNMLFCLPIFFLFQNCGSEFDLSGGLNTNESILTDTVSNTVPGTPGVINLPVNPPTTIIIEDDTAPDVPTIPVVITPVIIPIEKPKDIDLSWTPIITSNKTQISVDDFPVNTTVNRRNRIRTFFGHHNYYNKLSFFYNNLEDVYREFNINPEDILTCEKRHRQILESTLTNSSLKAKARNYFCEGTFNTNYCKQKQYKKVYLNYCLDPNDTLDWLALQATLLNANKRTVIIPAKRTFNINQVLIIPSDTKVVWLGSESAKFEGRSYTLKDASFIKFNELKINGFNGPEPLKNIRGLGYSTGTVATVANMPFVYSGTTATRKTGTTKNIELLFPHIDGSNFKGENGISFAQGVENVTVIGGHIKNIKMNFLKGVAWAGGKAIQCEAGCREVKINGINISNAYIGINSSAFKEYFHLTNGLLLSSDLSVDGILMDDVDLPINVMNDFVDKTGTQKLRVNNFLILNSGRMTDQIYYEKIEVQSAGRLTKSNHTRNNRFSNMLTGKLIDQVATQLQSNAKSYDLGTINSRGGYNTILSNGRISNSTEYGGIEEFISGYGTQVKIVNTEYFLPINCDLNGNLDGC